MRRYIVCDRLAMQAYYLNKNGQDIGCIKVSHTGLITSSSKPTGMTLGTWFIECCKAISLAKKIFASDEIPVGDSECSDNLKRI